MEEKITTENTEHADTVTEAENTAAPDTVELEKKISELEDKLAEKGAEYEALNDKYLRMMAEYDNFRKRSAKEREGVYGDAYADALATLLPIIDNLERAVGYSDPSKSLAGLEMILKSAKEALDKIGVTSFGEKGERFDPNRHNAVMHVEDETLGDGIIVDVFQKGYAKGDRIFRYAMVTVAN